MEVILLQKVHNLGDLGDLVTVKAGFARNYLVPQGFATRATKVNIESFEKRKAELKKQAVEQLTTAEVKKAQLLKLDVSLARRAGDEGKLFGSVGANDIAIAITEAGVNVQRKDIRLPDGPLRSLGEHTVVIHLHSDVNANVILNVEAAE